MSAIPRLVSAREEWRILRFDAINSTNEEARRLALAGDPGRLWIAADAQVAGRGRRRRSWVSPNGNLHATALLIDPCPPSAASQLGFVAGVALARAAADAGAERVSLKWPNDLMSHGVKCAGILVEGAGLAGRQIAYSVGIGVNCAVAPEGLPYLTARLARASGEAIGAVELLDRLIGRFDEAIEAWRGGEAFQTIREAWLDRASGVGQAIEIERAGGKRAGVFEGIDAGGRLLLRSDHALETVEAADFRILPCADVPGRASLAREGQP